MRIADADEAMLPQILEIERACFSDPWTPSILQSQISSPDHIFLAALEEETVVGYAGLTYVLDEGNITNVAVAPEWRRRGIADALLRELERRARAPLLKLAFLTLEVRAGNESAIALYEKHGYKPVGRRKNYYEKPVEDALLMTLELGTETLI